jgi:hypothetical protein
MFLEVRLVGHVILLGDSIFDNARYVPGGPSVLEHLRRALPVGWRATLLAVDGSTASDVARQLEGVPGDASYLVISTGGNNALNYSGLILHESASSFAEVLSRLGAICEEFQWEYRRMLEVVMEQGLPAVVCTIYDAIPRLDRARQTGVRLFNDVISREAFRAGLPVIDLRLVCCEASDYSSVSPIEPSVSGGLEIARTVSRAVTEIGAESGGSWVIV